MTAAPDERDVLTNIEADGVVMRKVDAKPDPPCVEIVEDASRASARRIAPSIDVVEGMMCSRGVSLCLPRWSVVEMGLFLQPGD